MAAADELGIVASRFVTLRTPLLPFAAFTAWGADLRAPGADGDALAAALEHDRALLRDRLREHLADAAVREALFVASPSLSERVEAWRRDPDGDAGRAVEPPLVRYFARMATRPTPFGLFAGVSLAHRAGSTRLCVSPRAAWLRRTRLDMQYLTALTDALAAAPELRAALPYRANSTLYAAAGRLRYIEARTAPATLERAYDLVSIEPTPVLEAVCARAAAGATMAELAAAIVDEDVSPDEATEYIHALIDAQVLVPELEPPLTGGEPIAVVAADLAAVQPGRFAAARLEEARRALGEIDASGIGVGPSAYRAVARSLGDLPATVDVARLVQVDLIKPAPGATVGPAVIDELARAAALFCRIGRTRRWQDVLRPFREAFVARYGARRVPLLEAVDEESGVGSGESAGAAAYASPLLAGLTFPPGDGPPERARTAREKRRAGHVLRLFERARARGAYEIALTDEDLAALENERPLPVPDSFYVMATIAARSSRAVDGGDFRLLLHSLAGPPGAALLSRFAGESGPLRAALDEQVAVEEALAPGVVFAEIVHLPQGRLGNVVHRPVLRGAEIAFLGRSGAPRDRQIPITDLLVSVRGDGDDARVVLHSAKDGREIRPRLTAAHAFEGADVGAYRLLCALARQPPNARVWDWDQLMRASFLPRVTAGRLVLSLAQWRLEEAEIRDLRGARGAARYATARALRSRRAMPRFVALAEGDQLLSVDFDNVLSVDSFVSALASREEAYVCELFPDGEHAPVHEGAGAADGRADEAVDEAERSPRFAHEIVVPFVRAASIEELCAGPPPAAPDPSVPRSFAPGSEWLFAKIYAGPATADDVLRRVVRPVVDAALAAGDASEWFFVRYGDPDWHVRLRLRGAPERLIGRVLPAIESATRSWRAAAGGAPRVTRLAFDTYEREIERFGGAAAIAVVERIFFVDSEAALALVVALEDDIAPEARPLVALLGVDRLLDDLGLSLDAKIALAEEVHAALARELRSDARLSRQLDAKYRRERPRLEALRARRAADLDVAYDIVDARSRRLRPLAAELAAVASVDAIAPSLAHMHANRVLRAAARAEEMVLYDMLRRLYASERARARGGVRSAFRGDPS